MADPGARHGDLGRAVVVTASDRAAAGVYADRSGPVLVDALRELGFAVDDAVVVPDGEPVEAALRAAVAEGAALVVTSGGTGLGPRDRTPEATRAVLEREVPGIAEALRADGVARGVPAAMLSRGLAGVAGRTLVVNVAGSTGAARDAAALLGPVLVHAVRQLRGADHG
ncbi:MogA/MoaB family molybdenum cofactor biosynthesis protein [Cellulomonas sp.]|uniref:MogA/MoaB family molybdenum cofactor biosynthesis protein n=1 Tax=Cellulomonas sp. TaxID=40001 RepID=UPI002811720A|nr:MogA/MoaB family molybdenum cofactor biosynthesis protein [Cellulomonas sp.]